MDVPFPYNGRNTGHHYLILFIDQSGVVDAAFDGLVTRCLYLAPCFCNTSTAANRFQLAMVPFGLTCLELSVLESMSGPGSGQFKLKADQPGRWMPSLLAAISNQRPGAQLKSWYRVVPV